MSTSRGDGWSSVGGMVKGVPSFSPMYVSIMARRPERHSRSLQLVIFDDPQVQDLTGTIRSYR